MSKKQTSNGSPPEPNVKSSNTGNGGTQPERTCFVIGPISGERTETRRRFVGLVNTVVRPALEADGYRVEDPLQTFQSGSITRQIIERLLEADLVVADLTELNANVMYELAVRHAKRLPVVILMRHPIDLPFDLKDEHTIEYVDDFQGADDLRETLRDHSRRAVAEAEPDNPVYRAARSRVIADIVSRGGDEFQQLMLNRLDDLTRAISDSRRINGGSPADWANAMAADSGIDWYELGTELLSAKDMQIVDSFAQFDPESVERQVRHMITKLPPDVVNRAIAKQRMDKLF